MAANPLDPQTVLLVPTDNDGVTEVLQMLEQELAAYEEQELAAIGTGRGGRDGRGRGRGRAIRSTRLEMEDLVDLAHETALARYKVYILLSYGCSAGPQGCQLGSLVCASSLMDSHVQFLHLSQL